VKRRINQKQNLLRWSKKNLTAAKVIEACPKLNYSGGSQKNSCIYVTIPKYVSPRPLYRGVCRLIGNIGLVLFKPISRGLLWWVPCSFGPFVCSVADSSTPGNSHSTAILKSETSGFGLCCKPDIVETIDDSRRLHLPRGHGSHAWGTFSYALKDVHSR
jgi:hypothetical protein